MSYHRSTRECSVTQFRPELRQGIREYFQNHQLGDLETGALLCCETMSEKETSNWFLSWLEGKTDSIIYTGMVLTAERLIWARTGDLSGLHVVGAELKYIQARRHVSVINPKDIGLEINGLVENSKSNIHGVVGLGPEPVGQKFCDEVHEAIKKINPPPTNKWPSWMGGGR